MSMRHRYGQQVIMRGAVDSATEIAMGDLVYLDTDDIKPAGSETWSTDLATTQSNFLNHFLGIALNDHPAGSGIVLDFPVDISPMSVYEMDCNEETHELGDMLTPIKATGNALVADTLKKTTTASVGCARCMRRDPTALTRVMVRFQSAYWGVNDATKQ